MGSQGCHPKGPPPQGLPPQGLPPQGLPPQGLPPQGLPPQGLPPQGLPPQGLPPHGLPPHGLPPHGVPQPIGLPNPSGLPKKACAGCVDASKLVPSSIDAIIMDFFIIAPRCMRYLLEGAVSCTTGDTCRVSMEKPATSEQVAGLLALAGRGVTSPNRRRRSDCCHGPSHRRRSGCRPSHHRRHRCLHPC